MVEVVWLVAFTATAAASCLGGYALGARNGRAGTTAVAAGARATGMMLLLLFVVQLYGIFGVLLIVSVPALYLLGWFRARESKRISMEEAILGGPPEA